MACRKITFKNETSSIGVYSYQECSDLIYIENAQISPGQIKSIWFRNGTFRSTYLNNLTILEDVPFPITPNIPTTPTPSNTPTNTPSVTPTITSSVTPTPTITSTVTPSISVSPSVTPTITSSVTPTPTITPTNTLTPTPTITPSQTPSFNFVVSNINTGGAYIQGVTGTTGTVTTKSGYSYPVDNGEFLYADFTTSGGNLEFNVEVKDPSLSDFQVRIKINGSTVQIGTPGPGNITLVFGQYFVLTSELVEVILENA